MTYHWVCNNINLIGVTSGGRTSYASGPPEFILVVKWVCVTRALIICVCFVDRVLSFCSLFSIYRIWLPLLYLQNLLSVVQYLLGVNHLKRIAVSNKMRMLKFDTITTRYSTRTLIRPIRQSIHFALDNLTITITLIISLRVIAKHFCNSFYWYTCIVTRKSLL